MSSSSSSSSALGAPRWRRGVSPAAAARVPGRVRWRGESASRVTVPAPVPRDRPHPPARRGGFGKGGTARGRSSRLHSAAGDGAARGLASCCVAGRRGVLPGSARRCVLREAVNFCCARIVRSAERAARFLRDEAANCASGRATHRRRRSAPRAIGARLLKEKAVESRTAMRRRAATSTQVPG